GPHIRVCPPLGNDGHHTSGAMADSLIAGTNAATQVKKLLNDGTLQKYAIWADCAKHYCKDWFTAEMSEFGQANPTHHNYHFTDIPIQEDHYFETSVGASADDIAHIVQQCIAVLQGDSDPKANPHGFSPRIALILLSHFVGDLHQPLHVGAVYIGPNETFVNPNSTSPTGYVETRGANYIMWTTSENFHAFWDTPAVKRGLTQAHAKTPAEYAKAILKETPPSTGTAGDIGTLPVQWAKETIQVAGDVFVGLQLGPRYTVIDPQSDKPHLQWNIDQKPTGYSDFARDIAHQHIKLAGYRLAMLLTAVWP